MRKNKARISQTLRIGATVVLLGVLVVTQDIVGAAAALRTLPVWMAAVAVGLFALRNLSHALRWWAILRGLGGSASFSWVHRAVYVGASANVFLPTSVGGDVVRGALARSAGLSLKRAASSVALDRGLGAAALGLMVAGLAFALPEEIVPPRAVAFAWVLVGALVVGMGIVAVRRRPVVDVTDRSDLGWITGAVLASVVVHGASMGALVVIARGVGIDAPAMAVAACATVAWIASLAPISVGGFGVREAVLVTLLGGLGVASQDALAVTLAWTALLLVQAVIGVVVGPGVRGAQAPAPDPVTP